jgi:hypothetical protein
MSTHVVSKFARIGARAKVHGARLGINGRQQLSINILHDATGEYFDIRQPDDTQLDAVDVRSLDRHLLLIAREKFAPRDSAPSKYLCGHDERHWFVAAVPENAHARDVQTAKDALMPPRVRQLVDEMKLARNARYTRRNRAFVRQGEWFFVPAPETRIDRRLVLRNEPIRRGAGKPHFCQELYRTGGQRVYVRRDYPNGLTEAEYREVDPRIRDRGPWRLMQRDAQVFVRGSVRHADHATIWLREWHQVFMNTETQARAMRHVAFLD